MLENMSGILVISEVSAFYKFETDEALKMSRYVLLIK